MSSSEPLNTTTAVGLRKNIDQRLQAAQNALGDFPQYRTLTRSVEAFYEALDDLDDAIRFARSNRLLSEEGRLQQVAPAVSTFRARAEEAISSSKNATAALKRNITERAKPQPPTTNESLLEARLEAMRQIAYRTLDAAPDGHAAKEMRDLAKGDVDPYMTYLLLGTSFPILYLRSRRDNAGAFVWEQYRQELLPTVLDADGAEALTISSQVQSVQSVPTSLNAAYQFTLRDNDL